MLRKTVAALVLAAALPGCGGGGHRKPPPQPAAFAAAVDRICADATTRSGRLARLRAVRAPRGDEDLYTHWLTAERDALDAVRPQKHPPKPDDPDPLVVLAIAQGKIAGYARRLGAEGCARSATGTLPP